MRDVTRELMAFVPPKEQSRIKALLAGKKKLTLKDSREHVWLFNKTYDLVSVSTMAVQNETFGWIIEDEQHLSPNMLIYGDLILFFENKGPYGYLHTVVTILNKNKGKVYLY